MISKRLNQSIMWPSQRTYALGRKVGTSKKHKQEPLDRLGGWIDSTRGADKRWLSQKTRKPLVCLSWVFSFFLGKCGFL